MLNINEMEKEKEGKYISFKGNESKIVTFLSDDEKIMNKSKNGNSYPVREFTVRTEDGSIKKLSLFAKDVLNLRGIVAAKFKTPIEQIITFIDLKVKVIQNQTDLNDNKTKSFEFICLSEPANKVVE